MNQNDKAAFAASIRADLGKKTVTQPRVNVNISASKRATESSKGSVHDIANKSLNRFNQQSSQL